MTAPTREAAGQVRRTRRGPATPVRALALGLLVLQIGWLFVVPPFRGIDEFDHVFRAAAVARGDWAPAPVDATRGTGAWVVVPEDLVDAAHPECSRLPYTTGNDCLGTPSGEHGVRIATGAGRYHPLFYALVGWPALPFDGYAALYVMRLVTVLLSWGLFCLALLAARPWATGPWSYVGLAVACTPVAVFGTGIVAPNGVETMAGIAFWSAAIGLLAPSRHRETTGRSRRTNAVVAAVAGTALASLRPLGPVWCLLIAAAVCLAVWPSRARLRALLASRTVLVAGGVIFLAALQASLWVVVQQALKMGTYDNGPNTLWEAVSDTLRTVPLWIFQSIAAFPFRNTPSHPLVYACYLLLFAAFFVAGLRAGTRHTRLGLAFVTFVLVAFPFVISVQTYRYQYGAWQGRYGLPLGVGMVILAGYMLDQRGVRVHLPHALVGGSLFVISHTVGQVHTVLVEGRRSPLAGTSAWLQPSPVLVAALAAVGSTLMCAGALARTPTTEEAPHG